MMFSVGKDWAVVIVFLLAIPVATVLEAFWISRRTGASIARSLFYSFTTNLFSTVIGFFVTFIIFGIILAMAWDGSIERVPASEVSLWFALITAVTFPLVLLIIAKRVGGATFHLPLNRPWIFSIISSLLYYAVILGFPAFVIFVI
jgi:hypothetical protein